MPKGAKVEEYKITKDMKTWLLRAQAVERLKQALQKQHKTDNMALLAMAQELRARMPKNHTHTAPGMEG